MPHVVRTLFFRTRHIALYGLLMAVLVFALKWLQWNFLILDHAQELYSGLLAVLFTGLGIWISTQLTKPRTQTIVIEKEVYLPLPEDGTINEQALHQLNLSNREYEVLQWLAKGKSNAEIAEALFLSVSTVKTHVSNLFVKMDVKSRTQAIEKAKRLKITA